MNVNKKSDLKLILSIGFLIPTLLLIYVHGTEYSSTDLSFYDNLLLLPIFIVFIGTTMLCFNKYDTLLKSNQFLYNICIFYFLFCIVVISQLWILKFGKLPDVDSWIHLSRVEECINFSKVDVNTNFYPFLVFLLSEISIITKIEPQVVYTYFPFIHVFCYALLILLTVNLYSRGIQNKLSLGYLFLIMLLNPIILNDSNMVPWSLNYLFIALYLFAYAENYVKSSIGWKIILILCLFSLIITHVLGAIFVFIATLFMYTYQQLFSIFSKKSKTTPVLINSFFIVLMFVIILTWLFITTDFLSNQMGLVIAKLPEILYGTPTVQQTITTSKSFSHFFFSWFNLISNIVIVLLSISYMVYKILINHKHVESLFEPKYFGLSFVLSGLILFFIIRYLTGQTEYSGISMRYLYYTSIVFPIFIYYAASEIFCKTNTKLISLALIFILVFSVSTIHSRPGYENSFPIVTDSFYKGIDWGNNKITFNENVKLITASDYTYQYMTYIEGYKMSNEILEGSTKGLLTYFNYNPELYKHRQESSLFRIKHNDTAYIYYYNLMEKYIAYGKYESKNIGLKEESFENKKNNKIYSSRGFAIFKLTTSEIDDLVKSTKK